ncbi:MAG: hypothetical protein ABI041_02465 [Bdellovibrionia bacterium]
MNLKKLAPILVLSLLGCKDPIIQGKLQVNSQLNLKGSSSRMFELTPGVHEMKIERENGRRSGTLKIQFFDHSDQRTVKIKVPSTIWIPNLSHDFAGDFEIKAAESGQPFDLEGKFETLEIDSPPDTQEVRCYEVAGTRLVTSHLHTKTTQINLDFKTTGTDETLAQFKNSSSQSTRVQDSIGPCVSP